MYDDRYSRRYNRRMNRYRNPMRGLAGGILIIGLAFAFFISSTVGWNFLAILFTVLAFVSLISAASSGNPRAFYGGLYPLLLDFPAPVIWQINLHLSNTNNRTSHISLTSRDINHLCQHQALTRKVGSSINIHLNPN